MKSRTWIRELLSIMAIGAAAAVAGLATRRARLLDESLRGITPTYQRARIHDRLMGAHLDVPANVSAPHRPRPAMFVWILDLDTCTGCFDTVADWAYLEQLQEYDFVIGLVGTVSPTARGRLRMLSRTRVTYWSRSAVQQHLGPILPNTKLMLDTAGTVLLVDSRQVGQECSWSFEAQAAALLGLPPARPIRAAPARLPENRRG